MSQHGIVETNASSATFDLDVAQRKAEAARRAAQVNQAKNAFIPRIAENWLALKLGECPRSCQWRVDHPENQPLICLMKDQIAVSELAPEHLQPIRGKLNRHEHCHKLAYSSTYSNNVSYVKLHDNFVALVRQTLPGFICADGQAPDQGDAEDTDPEVVVLSSASSDASDKEMDHAVSLLGSGTLKRKARDDAIFEVAKRSKEAEDAARQHPATVSDLAERLETEESNKKTAMVALQESLNVFEEYKATAGMNDRGNKAKIKDLETRLTLQTASIKSLENNLEKRNKDHDKVVHENQNIIKDLSSKLATQTTERRQENRSHQDRVEALRNDLDTQRARHKEQETLQRDTISTLEEQLRQRSQLCDQFEMMQTHKKDETELLLKAAMEAKHAKEAEMVADRARLQNKRDQMHEQYQTRMFNLKTEREALKAKEDLEEEQYQAHLAEIKAEEQAFNKKYVVVEDSKPS